MRDVLSLFYWALALAVPALAGPGAAAAYVAVLKAESRPQGRRGKWLALFWVMLVTWNALTFAALSGLLGEVLSMFAFLSCVATPALAIAGLLALRLLSRHVANGFDDQPTLKRWLVAGALLIPALQLLTVATAVLLGPLLSGIVHSARGN